MGIVLDVILIVIILLNVIICYKKGLVKLAVGLVAVIVSLILAMILYKPVTNIIIKNTEIDETEYTQKFSKETEELNLKIDVEGTYYLHVLTVDNAGNKVQQISEEIKIEKADIEYVTDGLIVYYDAINNTGNGHANNITTWKNLVSDKYNGIIHGGVWHEE